MNDAYGIFTTDGESVAGTLHDEYAVQLAERLDESTASLYISTKNGVFLLGTAVNVQKKGRRPDTFIYLERIGWTQELPPQIDLAYIHEFYSRVERRLSDIDYEVRDLASDDAFFDERHKRVITGLMSSDVADYSVGRLLLGKDVVCISSDLSKSVDFVVAVTGKLQSFISSGFTIVVARRSFRDADLLVTEKYSGTVHVDLNTERTEDPKWEKVYSDIGVFGQNPTIRPKLSKERTRENLEKRLLSAYKSRKKVISRSSERFEEFLIEEKIGTFDRPARDFSSSAYEPQAKKVSEHPKESDYSKWNVHDLDRENLQREYEDHMEKKRKSRIRLFAVLGVFIVLLVVVLVLFVFPSGLIYPGENETQIPHITPSATIEPDNSLILTRLNTTPGNSPEGMSGFGSAYEITVFSPQNVDIDLNGDYNIETPYYLMRYNQSGASWEIVNTTFLVSNESVTVLIADSGIYRLFTDKKTV